MEWCKPEKRRFAATDDSSLLQGCEKRSFGGVAPTWGATGITQHPDRAVRQQPTSLSFGSNAAVLPATHFQAINQNSPCATTSPELQADLLKRASGFSQGGGGQVRHGFAEDCSMDMDVDVVVQSRTAGHAPLMSTSSCSSSSSTSQSPMINSPVPTDFGQQQDPSSSPCRRCLAGDGGHFKHVISDRHEHHPWARTMSTKRFP